MEPLVTELRTISRAYQPGEGVRNELRRKFIVPIIGPTAVGKSSIIEAACRQDGEFSRVPGFTTRPQRDGEPADTYRFLPHTRETLQAIADKARSRSLVQLAVHPTTGYLYGSELGDYSTRYNLIDMLASEMDTIRKLPFAHCITIAVAMRPMLWQRLFLERHAAQQDRDDSCKRLAEARTSLEWSLQDTDTVWIENHDDAVSSAATVVMQVARGGSSPDLEARSMAKHMLQLIPALEQAVGVSV